MMLDEDAMTAAADLIGRTGAKNMELGFVHEDVPVEEAGWYCTVTYRGAKIIEEDHKGPQQAMEAMAMRLFQGAKCAHCRKPIRLDGKPGCRWWREGPKWIRGCEGARRQRRRRRGV